MLLYNHRRGEKERKGKKMTVKELKKILEQYDENDVVEVCGGECADGEFGYLFIGEDVVIES